MPLAILLAVAWADVLPAEEIAAQVRQGLGFLEAELRDLPERQRSMRAVFDASWRLLSQQERVLFPALTIFRGGFTAEAAQEVAGSDVRTLRSLVHKSFLEVDPGGRYQVHELLRQYGAEQLACTPGKEQRTRDRHCAYYAAALERWAEELKGPRQRAAGVELAAEIGNARAAWDWAVARGRWEDVGRAMDCLIGAYSDEARNQEGVSALRAAEVKLESATREEPAPRGEGTQAVALPALSDAEGSASEGVCPEWSEGVRLLLRVVIWQLSFAQNLDTCQRLVQRCEALMAHSSLANRDTRRERATFSLELASPSVWLADQPRVHAERALALYQELGDQRGMARAHSAFGLHAWLAGDYEEARKQYAQVLALSRSLDHQSGQVDAIGWLVMVAISQGHVDECEHQLRELSAMVASPRRNPLMMAWELWLLGGTHVAAGRYAQAEAELEECAAIFHDRGARVLLSRMLCHLCEAKMYLGRFGEARERLREAVPLAREGAQPAGEEWALTTLGAVAIGEG
jgi:tetratricopeptide (TPR) repeat protein